LYDDPLLSEEDIVVETVIELPEDDEPIDFGPSAS
jgi:hypothetical protein